MKISLFLFAAVHAKLTTTLSDGTQPSFEDQIADLMLGLAYNSKTSGDMAPTHPVTRRSNHRFGIHQKLTNQRLTHPNESTHSLTRVRSRINSLVTYRRKSKRNRVERNKIISSGFLV